MNPKEYTVEGNAEKEYTVKTEARKKKKRAHEEAHASSSLQITLTLRERINGSPGLEMRTGLKTPD